jgi:hypothetical protein
MLASEVLTHSAKVYLNDSAQASWTNTVLLPMLTEASLRLEGLLRLHGIPFIQKRAATIDVAALATSIAQNPTDFIEPISLREREQDSTNDWSDYLDEVDSIDPNIDDQISIICWEFRGSTIYINPPTTAREVLLEYNGGLTAISAVGSTIDLPQAKSYLAALTAELGAYNIGNNPTKGDSIAIQRKTEEEVLLSNMLKNSQGVGGVRRKGYRSRS